MPRCLNCKQKFEPKRFLQKHCESADCEKSAQQYLDDKISKALKTVKQKKKQDWNKEKIEIENKLKTLTDWQKQLEKPINKISCLIDKGSGCISCNGKTTPQGGHYHSVKSNGSIRFNLDNIHLQDYNCNCRKGANIHNYDLGLIDRYGKEYWEYVKFEIVSKFPLLKLHKYEYQEKIDTANRIVKWLQLQDKEYNSKQRLELRKRFNQEIGIYN